MTIYQVYCKFLGSPEEHDSSYPSTYEGLLGALARIRALEAMGGRAWSIEIERELTSESNRHLHIDKRWAQWMVEFTGPL
jgi:hypothetical protein